jgi:FKBP-type peptidyl-prolyl cis-trans isomerase FkpA
MKYLIYTVITLTLVLSSCSKAKKTDYTAKNEQEIKNYISQNHLSAHRSDSGLYYIIKNPGTGTNPTENSNVTVAYKGYFTDGTVFDKSSDKGISFGLDQVIKGWTEGIPLF